MSLGLKAAQSRINNSRGGSTGPHMSGGRRPPPIPASSEYGEDGLLSPPPDLPHSPRDNMRPRGGTPPRSPRSGRSSGRSTWAWEDSAGSKKKLQMLYKMIDHVGDLSGTISSTELNHMLVNLGEDVDEDMADRMVDLVDLDGSGEIDFEEFYTVLTGSVNSNRKPGHRSAAALGGRRIRDVRANFDAIDEDNSGYLDRDEVAKLANIMGADLKRRHLIDAMKQMDPTNSGQVTFDMFKNWLVDTAEGRHWTDFLVLPEGAVAAIHEEAKCPKWNMPAQGSGDPTVEWQRLSILLKIMSQAMDIWGCPEMMYCQHATKAAKAKALKDKREKAGYTSESDKRATGIELLNAEDVEMEARAKRCFFHPHMATRTTWDLVQVCLLFYLLLAVPVRIAFDREVETWSLSFWVDAVVDAYFVVDIFLNFRTPYYNERGVLEIEQAQISRNYINSWLLIDVIACLPVSYVVLIIYGDDGGGGGGTSIRILKVLRLLKLGKLLRVARLIRMLERYQDQLRSLMKTVGGLVLMVFVLLLAHLFGCVWYYVGTEDQVENVQDGIPAAAGWVEREFAHGDGCRADGTLQVADPDDASTVGFNSSATNAEAGEVVCLVTSFVQRYLTAVYWALMTVSTVGYGDIVAKTGIEKLTACFSMVFGALLFALISGDMASRFVATKGAVVEFNKRMEEVSQWLLDKNVSVPQRRQIEAHFRLLWGSNLIYDERAILELLPRVIRDPLLGRMYSEMLGGSALFAPLVGGMDIHIGQANCSGRHIVNGHEILGNIAMRMTHTVGNFGLIIVEEGHQGDEMFFIESGEVDVYCTGRHHKEVDTDATNGGSIDTSVAHWRGELGVRLGRLGVKAWFGETAVMSRKNNRERMSELRRGFHRRTVVSRSACHFHKLHKNDVDDLRFTFSVLDAMLKRIEAPLNVPVDDGSEDSIVNNEENWQKREEQQTSETLRLMQKQFQEKFQELGQQNQALEAKLDNAMASINEMVRLMHQEMTPPPAPPVQDDPDG